MKWNKKSGQLGTVIISGEMFVVDIFLVIWGLCSNAKSADDFQRVFIRTSRICGLIMSFWTCSKGNVYGANWENILWTKKSNEKWGYFESGYE